MGYQGDKLVETLRAFKDEYNSVNYKNLSVKEQRAKKQALYSNYIQPSLLQQASAGKVPKWQYDLLAERWQKKLDEKFPDITPPADGAGRAAVANFGAGVTDLASDVGTVGGKILGIKPWDKSLAEKTKDELYKLQGVPSEEVDTQQAIDEQKHPIISGGARLAGNVAAPLPILGKMGSAAKAFKNADGVIDKGKAVASAFGSPLIGPELATGKEVFQAGKEGIKKVATQTGADVLESALNPAVNPRGLKQLAGQVASATGLNTAATQIEKGEELDLKKLTEDETRNLLITAALYGGVKVLQKVFTQAKAGHTAKLPEPEVKTPDVEGKPAGGGFTNKNPTMDTKALTDPGVTDDINKLGAIAQTKSNAEKLIDDYTVQYEKALSDINAVGGRANATSEMLLRLNDAKRALKNLSKLKDTLPEAVEINEAAGKSMSDAEKLIQEAQAKKTKKANPKVEEDIKIIDKAEKDVNRSNNISEIPIVTHGSEANKMAYTMYGDKDAQRILKLDPLDGKSAPKDITEFVNTNRDFVTQALAKGKTSMAEMIEYEKELIQRNLNDLEATRGLNDFSSDADFGQQVSKKLTAAEKKQLAKLDQNIGTSIPDEVLKEKPTKSLSELRAENRAKFAESYKPSNKPIVLKDLKDLPTAFRDRQIDNLIAKGSSELANIAETSSKKAEELLSSFGGKQDPNSLNLLKTITPENQSKFMKLLDSLDNQNAGGLTINPAGTIKHLIEWTTLAAKKTKEAFDVLTGRANPIQVLEKSGLPKVYSNVIKLANIEAKRYITEIEDVHLEALRQLKITREDFPKLASILDNVAVDDILSSASTEAIMKKAKVVASFFRQSAQRAGLPTEKYLKAYFPHIQELDPEAAAYLSDYVKKGSAFFMKDRGLNSTLGDIDVLAVMKAYGAGTRRSIIKKSQTVLEDLKAELPIDSGARKAVDQIIANMTNIYRPSIFDAARSNMIENALRFNLHSALLNSTQTIQTLLPEIGMKNYMDIVGPKGLLHDKTIIEFLKKVGIEDDLFSKYDVFSQAYGPTEKLTSLADHSNIEFLKHIDLFSNAEKTNRLIAGIAGMVRQAGSKEQLLARLKSMSTRAEENELLIAAQDLIERTQFANNPLNRTGLQTSETTRMMLTFQTVPLREAGLVADWTEKIINGATSGNQKLMNEGLGNMGYYLASKTLLAGKAGATILIPSALWSAWRSVHPESYRTFQDALEPLDELSVPGKMGWDLSQSIGLIDPTDHIEKMITEPVVLTAISRGLRAAADLSSIAGGDVNKAKLTPEEKAAGMTSEEAQPIETAKRVTKDIADIALTTVRPGAIPFLNPRVPGTNVQLNIGTGAISKAVKGAENDMSGRNTIANISRETNGAKEFLRQINPLKEDTARLNYAKAKQELKYFLERGLEPPKGVIKTIEAAGFSLDDVEADILGKIQPSGKKRKPTSQSSKDKKLRKLTDFRGTLR